jgi:Methyltransferase domain
LNLPDTFPAWISSLEQRHLGDLTFAEVSRALRALSSAYVERRHKLTAGAALSGAGKRAAFALFYGPLHFLLVHHIVTTLAREVSDRSDTSAPGHENSKVSNVSDTLIFDLGCGTGASGAGWATACSPPPRIVGVDRHPWAVGEAARTYREFGLDGRARQDNVTTAKLPKGPASILAAFTLNELADASRNAMLKRLLDRVSQGDRVLIVEPLAGSVAPWWNRWREAFASAGGRADQWRFRTELPPIVAKLDRAAGLDHREITGRSLWSG